MILSDSSSIDPANLIIEIGSFGNSFDPDYSNMSAWLTQWRIFDAITDSDPATATTDADSKISQAATQKLSSVPRKKEKAKFLDRGCQTP